MNINYKERMIMPKPQKERHSSHKHENCTYLFTQSVPVYGACIFSDKKSVPVNLYMVEQLKEITGFVDQIDQLSADIAGSVSASIHQLKKSKPLPFSLAINKSDIERSIKKLEGLVENYQSKRKNFRKKAVSFCEANKKIAERELQKTHKKFEASTEQFTKHISDIQKQFSTLKSTPPLRSNSL